MWHHGRIELIRVAWPVYSTVARPLYVECATGFGFAQEEMELRVSITYRVRHGYRRGRGQ